MRFDKVTVLVACLIVCSAQAEEDWTQWGGVNRDFKVDAVELNSDVSLSERWRRELGAGYSAILVENDKLYTMYRSGDKESVICLQADDGKTIWERQYSAPMKPDAETSFGKGPNSTPIIVGNSLVAIGFNGDMHCLDKTTGDVRWLTNVIDDLGGTNVDLGYSQSPIVYDGGLILPVGGEQKGVVSLNLDDGSVNWSALDYKNSYSTPVLAAVDGLDQMIFVMTDEVISVNPKNGELFWTFPLTNQWSTHAFVPVWDPVTSTLFVSSFRQSHALALKRNDGAIEYEVQWSNPRSGIGFTNAVIVNGVVIGTTGGSQSPFVTGIELKTGNILWRERGFGVSNFLAVGNRVVLLDDDGDLAVTQPGTAALNVQFKEKVLHAPKVWTVPTMVGNQLFMRDQKEIVAYALK